MPFLLQITHPRNHVVEWHQLLSDVPRILENGEGCLIWMRLLTSYEGRYVEKLSRFANFSHQWCYLNRSQHLLTRNVYLGLKHFAWLSHILVLWPNFWLDSLNRIVTRLDLLIFMHLFQDITILIIFILHSNEITFPPMGIVWADKMVIFLGFSV